MKSFEQIAEAMYHAYRKSIQQAMYNAFRDAIHREITQDRIEAHPTLRGGGVAVGSILGQLPPEWGTLEQGLKHAWIAAAKQAAAELALVH